MSKQTANPVAQQFGPKYYGLLLSATVGFLATIVFMRWSAEYHWLYAALAGIAAFYTIKWVTLASLALSTVAASLVIEEVNKKR